MFVLAAVWFAFTVPATSASGTTCQAGTQPETMGRIILFQRAPGDPVAIERFAWNVAGLEGAWLEWTLQLDAPALVSLVAEDAAGNRSCPSTEVLLSPPPVSVGPPGEAAAVPGAPPRFYDVLGRRAAPPLGPGVFWRVEAGRPPRRVVVVR